MIKECEGTSEMEETYAGHFITGCQITRQKRRDRKGQRRLCP